MLRGGLGWDKSFSRGLGEAGEDLGLAFPSFGFKAVVQGGAEPGSALPQGGTCSGGLGWDGGLSMLAHPLGLSLLCQRRDFSPGP